MWALVDCLRYFINILKIFLKIMAKSRKKSNIKFLKKTPTFELPDLQPQKRRKMSPVMFLVIIVYNT